MITVRPIRPDDHEFLYQVYASTRQDELAPLQWSEDQKESFLRMQFDAQHKHYLEHYANAEFSMIESNGEPIGRLYVDRRPDEIRIVDIALLPQHRRNGGGGAILRDILDEAAGDGKSVTIHVERFNPALRLYERLGFVKIGDVGVYYLMRWSRPGANS